MTFLYLMGNLLGRCSLPGATSPAILPMLLDRSRFDVRFIGAPLIQFLVLTFTANAFAALAPLSESFGGMEMHALLRISNEQSFLVSTSLARNGSTLSVTDFAEGGSSRRDRISIPLTLTLLATQAGFRQNDVLVAGSDVKGQAHLILIDWKARRVRSVAPAPSFLHITTVAATTQGFWVGGISTQNRPIVVLLDKSLAVNKSVDLAQSKNGEVTSLFQTKDRLFVVANFSDATSAIYEISSGGTANNVLAVSGGAATAIPLSDGGVAVSYRTDREAFVQKLDAAFYGVGTTKVLDIKGVTTRIPRLVEFNNKIIWIGANEGKLTIHSFSLNGKRDGTPASDDRSRHAVPHRKTYLAAVAKGRLYIQGQSVAENTGPVTQGYVEYKFAFDQ